MPKRARSPPPPPEWLFCDGALQGPDAPPLPGVTRILAADLGAGPDCNYAEYDPETRKVTYATRAPVPSCWLPRDERHLPLLPGWQGPGWYACYRRESPRYFGLASVRADRYRYA